MRQPPALLCLILCYLILYCLSGQAMAQTTIHRCIGANGGAVFSDQPCAALQATPVGASKPPTAVSTADASTAPPPILCAASVGKLRQSIIEAFARHDANRLAGLILWDGYSEDSVTGDIQSLNKLVKEALLDINVPGTAGTNSGPAPAQSLGGIELDPFDPATPTAPAPAPDGNRLLLHTAGNDGSQERRFDLVRRAGCLWLRIAD